MESEEIGLMVDKFFPLVEDWSADNDISDGDNVNWIQESYNDWVSAKDKTPKESIE